MANANLNDSDLLDVLNLYTLVKYYLITGTFMLSDFSKSCFAVLLLSSQYGYATSVDDLISAEKAKHNLSSVAVTSLKKQVSVEQKILDASLALAQAEFTGYSEAVIQSALLTKLVASNSGGIIHLLELDLIAAAQQRSKADVQLSLVDIASWQVSNKDENTVGLSYSPALDVALLTTYWHNRIIQVEQKNHKIIAKSNIAVVSGARYVVDSRSGATEHILRNSVLNQSGDEAFILISPKKTPKIMGQEFGIYRTKLTGAIPDDRALVYRNKSVVAMALSADNKSLVAITNDAFEGAQHALLKLDVNQLKELKVIPWQGEILAAQFVANDLLALSVESDDFMGIQLVRYSDMKIVQKIAAEDAPEYLHFANQLLVSGLGKEVVIYAINQGKLEQQQSLKLPKKLRSVGASPSGDYLLVGFGDHGGDGIYWLKTGTWQIDRFTPLDSQPSGIVFNGQGQLLVSAKNEHLQRYDYQLKAKQSVARSLAIDAARVNLKNVAADNMFVENQITPIVSNLDLMQSLVMGEGSRVTWDTSQMKSINHAGVVQRGKQDESGQITAYIEYADASTVLPFIKKEFNVTVRAKTKLLGAEQSWQPASDYIRTLNIDASDQQLLLSFKGGFDLLSLSKDGEYVKSGKKISKKIKYANLFDSKFYNKNTYPKAVIYADGIATFVMGSGGDNKFGAIDVWQTKGEVKRLNRILLPQGLAAAVVSDSKIFLAYLSGEVGLLDLQNIDLKSADPKAIVNLAVNFEDEIDRLAVSPDGKKIFARKGHQLYLFDTETKKLIKKTLKSKLYSIAATDKQLVVGDYDGYLTWLNFDLQETHKYATGYATRVASIQVTPDSLYLSLRKQGIQKIDLASQQEVGFYPHPKQYGNFTVSGDKLLISESKYRKGVKRTLGIIRLED